MAKRNLGKRLKDVRQERGLTAEHLSELCNINAVYLRQIESGRKIPSLPVFIDLCNALKVSPDYLLQDALVVNEIANIDELSHLWECATPKQQEVVSVMVRAVLDYFTKNE